MLRLASLAVLILLACLASGGCTQRVDIASEQATLFNRDTEWSRAAEGKDVEAILSFVADDAIFFPPDGPILQGKEAIRNFWSELAETPDFSLSWEATGAVVSRAGDMGYTHGLALVTRKDEKGNTDTKLTKYVTIWKKQPDGSWQVVVDMRALYRVRILVETEAEAESLSARIGNEQKLKTWIVPIP
jgi:ketosteroid isomerase-like protein